MQQLVRVMLIVGLAGSLSSARPGALAALAAAIFTVNSAADLEDDDPGDGTCETAPGSGLCTLRAAIQETNALGGANTVVLPALPPGGRYLLTLPGGNEAAAATGDLDITSQLTLTGAGAGNTIIDANGAATNDRALEIHVGAALTLTGVTVRNGRHPTAGGGLRNSGRLYLADSIVMSNTVPTFDEDVTGGGLSNEPGGVSGIERVIFQENQSFGRGGAIWNGGQIAITASLMISNFALYYGGGFANTGSPLVLHGSTLLANEAELGGGGFVDFGRVLVARNSTISGNKSNDEGGGLFLGAQSVTTLMNVTVTGNTALNGAVGGGLRVVSSAVVNMGNSMLSGNAHRSGGGPIFFLVFDECFGTINSLDYNLVRILTNCTITGPDTPGLLGVAATGTGPFGQNGGPTPTLALQPGSNLVDAGNPAGCTDEHGATLATDQRGFFTRAVDGDGDQNAICDIGAYELGAKGPLFLPYLSR
jgi:CSLREA domain-containing protein